MAGFSLLELLVALAVFGMAVVALLNLSTESARTAAVLEERTLAALVAENQICAALLAPPASLGAAAKGQERAGGRVWQWQRQSQPAGAPGLLRIDVRVYAEGQAQELAQLQVVRSVQ